jgi:hypothetical protein
LSHEKKMEATGNGGLFFSVALCGSLWLSVLVLKFFLKKLTQSCTEETQRNTEGHREEQKRAMQA